MKETLKRLDILNNPDEYLNDTETLEESLKTLSPNTLSRSIVFNIHLPNNKLKENPND